MNLQDSPLTIHFSGHCIELVLARAEACVLAESESAQFVAELLPRGNCGYPL